MSNQKSITPNQILSVKVSYEDMSGMIEDSGDFFGSDDASNS